jgi:hypothetical protein
LVPADWDRASATIAHRRRDRLVRKSSQRSAGGAGRPNRLASAYALRGETERAAAELAEARRLAGDDSFSSIARMKARGSWGAPKTRALFDATHFVGLRKAGMTEE